MVIPFKEEDRVQYNSDEKDTYTFVMEHIETGEPCCIVGLAGRGKTGTFRGLTRVMSEKICTIPNAVFLSFLIKADSNQKSILDEIEQKNVNSTKTIYALIHIASGADGTALLSDLSKIRDLQGFRFVSFILSDLSPIYDAYILKSKYLFRALRISRPLERADAMGVLHSFETRFKYTLTDAEKETIYYLSGGAVGLMKSLYLFTKTNNGAEISTDNIHRDIGVQQRLETMRNDLPPLIRKKIDQRLSLTEEEEEFLSTFGVINASGTLCSPLFQLYMDKKRDIWARLLGECKKPEIELLEKFRESPSTLLTRDEIAQCLWGANWENEYSDWAIDQAIHRLREKIKNAKLPYEIRTRKGTGFYLTPLPKVK